MMMMFIIIVCLITGSLLPPSGAYIAELKSKVAASRHSSNTVADPSQTAANDSSSSAAVEPQYEPGPRIKHVCRRAAIVFGERAMFPPARSSSSSSSSLVSLAPEINLSALPSHEKRHVVRQSAVGL